MLCYSCSVFHIIYLYFLFLSDIRTISLTCVNIYFRNIYDLLVAWLERNHLQIVIVKYTLHYSTVHQHYSLSLYHVKHPWNCNITRYSLCSFEVCEVMEPNNL